MYGVKNSPCTQVELSPRIFKARRSRFETCRAEIQILPQLQKCSINNN